MTRRPEKLVVVGKKTTAALLLAVTLAMLGVTLWVSGKAYAKVDAVPFRDLRVLTDRMSEGPVPMPTVIALITPLIFNMLLFLPWGFLMFVLVESPRRPASQAYLLTILFAMAFSMGVEAWQYFLPTRVTDINDVIGNVSGALVGAILGHLRKRVRISFE